MSQEYNKYKLQILLNNGRKLSQFAGNGVYKEYVAGCFKSGKYFRAYPIMDVYYLAIGDISTKLVEVDREPVDNDDFIDHARNPKKFMKYVNILIDRYLKNVEDELPIRPI